MEIVCLGVLTFNSTRCIRNLKQKLELEKIKKTFNSTRCIRNRIFCVGMRRNFLLSTPHGALGTITGKSVTHVVMNFQLHTVHQEHYIEDFKIMEFAAFNSTRCIRNPKGDACSRCLSLLSTPHGALGTSLEEVDEFMHLAFNSTRCIRNLKRPH